MTLPDDMSVRALLYWGASLLKESGLSGSRHEARLLLSKASSLSREQIIAAPEKFLSPQVYQSYQGLVNRRAHDRVPISRLIGTREFWSLPFSLSPETLDPRPDSETLVEAVLKLIKKQNQHDSALRLLDLGTGSGCLLIALLSELPHATGIGVDLSHDAVETAKRNAALNQVDSRSSFIQMDWGSGLREPFDIIISNPPYIPESDLPSLDPEVRCHDPHKALTSGPEGLEAYRQLAPQIHTLLKEEGVCGIEFGKDQHVDIEKIFDRNGLPLMTWHKDLSGIIRCGLFHKNEPPPKKI